MDIQEDGLIAKLDAVADAKSLLTFIRALVIDRKMAAALENEEPTSPFGRDAGGWENVRIETYLDAATCWAETTNFGLSQGLAEDNPWARFAHFLYLGKIYE